VIVAGGFGAFTASRKILWVQAVPGAIALALVLLARARGWSNSATPSGSPRRSGWSASCASGAPEASTLA